MPFNPDEAAKKLGLKTEIQAAGSAAAFDPDKAAQSLGLKTLPNQGNIQNGPSTAEAIGRGSAQGATMGFGDELSAAAGALFPTATDKQLDRGYTDRYASIRDNLRGENKAAEAAHPVESALSEIVSSAVPTVLTGGLLRTGAVTAAAIQGGAFGLGKSSKESIPQALTDTALSAGLSAVAAKSLSSLGKAMSQGAKEAGVDFSSAVGEFGDPIRASMPLKATVQPGTAGEILKISYNKKPGEAFDLGREMQASLANPEVKASIVDELNVQPKQMQDLMGSIKQKIGPQYDAAVQQYGDVTSDLTKVFTKARDNAAKVFEKSDISVEKSKNALLEVINSKESDLVAKYGSLNNVPLSELSALKQDIGNLVFEQKAFKKAGTDSVNAVAKKFWGGLKETLAETDKTKATGGTLAKIDDIYSALYNMADEMPSGANLLGLANPKNATARANFDTFLSHWAKVPSDTRALYGKELTNYIQQDLSKAISKGQLMQAVDKAGSPGLKALGVYLPTRDGMLNYANKLGAAMGAPAPASAPLGLGAAGQSVRQAVAPGLGALAVDKAKPEGGPALNELK